LAGDPDLEVKPEEIAAEEVEPDTVQSTTQTAELQPAETQPEQARPVDPEPVEAVQPAQEVTRVSPETAVAAEPEILVSENPSETFGAQPMATAVPEQPLSDEIPTAVSERAETATVQPTEVQPVEVQPEEVKPVETAEISPEPELKPLPTPKPKLEKPKVAEKKQPKKRVQPTGGKEGSDRQESTKGVSSGQDAPETDGTSVAAGRGDGMGSAAVANYPGKVQKRIRRSVRVPNEYKEMKGVTVSVRLTINGTGRVDALSITRSSGIAELDRVVLDGVRRAAPFPPLPSEWGKATWSFTQSVEVSR